MQYSMCARNEVPDASGMPAQGALGLRFLLETVLQWMACLLLLAQLLMAAPLGVGHGWQVVILC